MSFFLGVMLALLFIREGTRKVGRPESQKLWDFAIYVKDAPFFLNVYIKSVVTEK